MIHQPLGGAQGQASDILIAAQEIEKIKKELYSIISEHSGQPIERIYADGMDYKMLEDMQSAAVEKMKSI